MNETNLDSIFDCTEEGITESKVAETDGENKACENKEADGSGKAAEALNKDTELVFLIDESGSMSGFEDDTVGGFNAMIEKQRAGEGRVYVSVDNNWNVSNSVKSLQPAEIRWKIRNS